MHDRATHLLEDHLASICRIAGEICGARGAFVLRADAPDDPFVALAREEAELVVVGDARDDARLAAHPRVRAGEIRFCAVAPLRAGEGELGGALIVHDRAARALDDKARATIAVLARAAATELYVAARTARRARLEEALDAAVAGVWAWDFHTSEVTWRAPATGALLPEPFDGSIETLQRIIHPDDYADCVRAYRSARESGKRTQHRFRVVSRDGSVRWVRVVGRFTLDGHGEPIRVGGVTREATSDEVESEAIRAANEKLASVLENISDGFVTIDRAGRYTYVNARAAEMLGRTREALVGQDVWRMFPETMSSGMYEACQQAMEERVVVLREAVIGDGRAFENRICPSPDGVSVFFMDATERQRAAERDLAARAELKALTKRLITAREDEAARISRELHDGMGQALTALKMDVTWLRGSVPQSAHAQVDQISSLLDATLASMRRLAAQLRPSLLEDLGLLPALEWLVDEHRARATGEVTLTVPKDEASLGLEMSVAFFRVLQESLTNVLRHAHAQHTAVRFDASGGVAVLEIADDGCGFSPDAPPSTPSLGLRGMRERIESVGGELRIESVPGAGTRVIARAPLGSRRKPTTARTAR